MPANDESARCPRCGRRSRVFDLTATSITCPECDPAWDLVRHGERPPFGSGDENDAADGDDGS
jgi:hypothetical protein